MQPRRDRSEFAVVLKLSLMLARDFVLTVSTFGSDAWETSLRAKWERDLELQFQTGFPNPSQHRDHLCSLGHSGTTNVVFSAEMAVEKHPCPMKSYKASMFQVPLQPHNMKPCFLLYFIPFYIPASLLLVVSIKSNTVGVRSPALGRDCYADEGRGSII